MLAGCTGYTYWYMRAHWVVVATGVATYGTANKKNTLLPRAYVMSHFAKHVTGSTRLKISRATFTTSTNSDLESSAFIKGDSIIVMAINSTGTNHELKIKLPFYVKSGTHLLSTGNDKTQLCQEQPIALGESVKEVVASMPANSLSTYILMIDKEATAISDLPQPEDDGPKTYYDLQGRRLDHPHGLCIEKFADGSSRKVYIKD